jgi:hypothetical protein
MFPFISLNQPWISHPASGSTSKAGSINLGELSGSEPEENNEDEPVELHLPVVMVLFVLLSYCAIGGLLFCNWEGWTYFEGFYFCFITMATVGGFTNKIDGEEERIYKILRIRRHCTYALLHLHHPGLYHLWTFFVNKKWMSRSNKLLFFRATMCIDLAGTEYIRKIHYLGTKMEGARGTVITGLRAGENILKHRGQ